MSAPKEKLLKIANAVPLRVAVIFLVCVLLSMLLADILYPSLTAESHKQVTAALAEKNSKGLPTRPEMLEDLQQYNLAWYYITTADGHAVKKTEAYNPQLKAPIPNVSRPVDWRGKRYWESVAPMVDGEYLHVGFYTGPVVFGELFRGANAPWPYAAVLIVFLSLLILTAVALYICISMPLNNITRALRELLPEGARDGHDEFDFLVAPTEVKQLSQAISMVRAHGFARKGQPATSDEVYAGSAYLAEKNDRFGLGRDYEELSETQSRISEAYSKEAEDEFVAKLTRELDPLVSSHQICQRVLDKLNDKFPTSIIYGAFFKADKDGRFNIDAFLGLDDRSLQNLKRIDHTRVAGEAFAAGVSNGLTVQVDRFKDYGLQPLIGGSGIKTAIYLPVAFLDRKLGLLAVFFSSEGQVVNDRMRVLRSVADSISRNFLQATIHEEELDAARTDALTGLRNQTFLAEVLPQVFTRAAVDPEKNPVSFVILDGDKFSKINEVFGQVVGDQVLQEFSATIKQCARTSEGDGHGGPGDYLIRYGGEEFLLVMENTDAKRATDIAERIRWTVDNKVDWPGGVGKWTISAGIATYPQDAKNGEELIALAQTAVFFVKEEQSGNKVAHIQNVPKNFKATGQTAAIDGELGVFDGAALLQSLATAQKTGVLTVNSPDGKLLWMLFESGKPVQARLGKFYGTTAIVEFVTTFKEGNFNFKDSNTRETFTKLPKLDDTYNVKKGLERCLMDGALAQDNFNAARAVIPTAELIVRPVHAMEFAARWGALSQLPDPPSADEFNAMSDMVQRADGSQTLTAIFRAMDTVPTAVLWRSAALLIQHGLMQTKPAVPV